MHLLIAFAFAVASQGPQQQEAKRPDSAQERTQQQPQVPPPTTAIARQSNEQDTAGRDGNAQKRRTDGDIRATDVIMAGATVLMAIIAGLQLRAYNAQSRTIAAQRAIIEGHVAAMNKVAHETEMAVTAHQLQAVRIEEGNAIATRQAGMMEATANAMNELRISIDRLGNRLTSMQEVLKARNRTDN